MQYQGNKDENKFHITFSEDHIYSNGLESKAIDINENSGPQRDPNNTSISFYNSTKRDCKQKAMQGMHVLDSLTQE